MSKERFVEFVGQAKRALVAASREAEGLNVDSETVISIGDHITAALCSVTAAGSLFATADGPRRNRDELEEWIREKRRESKDEGF